MRNNEIIQQNKEFEMLMENSGFQMDECTMSVFLNDKTKYRQLKLDTYQRSQVASLLQHIPQALAANSLSQAYIVKFPKGLPHVLTALKQGGYSTALKGPDGHFVGTASLYPISAQAAALGAFSAMSAVTGQYFLSEINSELKLVNTKIDQIINFLYGEKKAELLAEINFVKYVHENFASIMAHSEQRLSTITNLQAAKKVAMKDIEFYLADLERIANKEVKDYSELCSDSSEALSIKESLEMSRQLFVVSGMLELYCAQNYDKAYLCYVEEDVIGYINKSDSRIAKCLGTITGKMKGYRAKPFENISSRDEYIGIVERHLEPYQNGKDSELRTALHKSLAVLNREEKYYLDASGNAYKEVEEQTR